MQDWSNENQKPGRPAASFGRRAGPTSPQTPGQLAPAQPPVAAPPAPSHPAPAPPRVPLSSMPQLKGQPIAPPPSPLPISSQQLQLFKGPMGKLGAAPVPEEEPLYDPPPLMPPPMPD